MLNILIAGVGGQGSVLAAKILAQTATERGWQVRTAETIGMAQRGGSVTSHVRIGNNGEQVHAPLISRGQADVVIALEPGEGLRALPYLADDGLMVCARTAIPSVMADLGAAPYNPQAVLDRLEREAAWFVAVDDAVLCRKAGSRKALNVVMLAMAVQVSVDQARRDVACGLGDAICIPELKAALKRCVKPRFVDMNLAAIDAVTG